ncbi:hypothetical protein Mal15_02870 [Stieleria maiorica]|uniref:Uncharacterized protein n=1 Tax=Stieleria maiorica TaxID=2795974 RepID=A0A5B9M883_9BACT|nr:hypothetical protein Mal15_02870 [Stieleria maiorica]
MLRADEPTKVNLLLRRHSRRTDNLKQIDWQQLRQAGAPVIAFEDTLLCPSAAFSVQT